MNIKITNKKKSFLKGEKAMPTFFFILKVIIYFYYI
jgi:hypothetical protein